MKKLTIKKLAEISTDYGYDLDGTDLKHVHDLIKYSGYEAIDINGIIDEIEWYLDTRKGAI